MLAYVYGVVPISLCRGGGCGVSRGKGRGVRIDFDEDDGPITGRPQNIHHLLWKVAPLHLYSSQCSTCEWMCLQWRTRGEPSSLPALARVAWKVQWVASAPPPQARDCLLLELWAILLILTPWQEVLWVPIMANIAGGTQVLCPLRLWSDKLEGFICLWIVNSQ